MTPFEDFVEDIVRKITKDALKHKPAPPNELEMLLQQHDFELAMRRINQTIRSNVIKMMDNLKPPQEWSDVYFEYICIDFGNGLKLDEGDYKLSAMALRHNYNDLFNVDTIISSCHKSLKLSDRRQFFLYLHIDEFQLIDIWDKNNKTSPPKELFKNIISDLATYMVLSSPSASSKTISSIFVQPFLSETAPYDVIAQKEASKTLFDFVECPLLDTASIIWIMDHFALKFNTPTFSNRVYKWKLYASLLQLLLDTGGLPHTLEQKCELDKKYNVKHYVVKNRDLAIKILYNCIEGIPVTPDTCLENVKVKDLEHDGCIILSKVNENSDSFLILMPIFFVYIYNDVLKIVDVELTNKIFKVDNHMFWQEWKLFVLHHEAFCTNLAIKMGKTGMTLGELYPGAYGVSMAPLECVPDVISAALQVYLCFGRSDSKEVPIKHTHHPSNKKNQKQQLSQANMDSSAMETDESIIEETYGTPSSSSLNTSSPTSTSSLSSTVILQKRIIKKVEYLVTTFVYPDDMNIILKIPITFGNEESPSTVTFYKLDEIKPPVSEETQNDIKLHTLQVIDIPLNFKAASVHARFRRYGDITHLTMRTRGVFQHAFIEYLSSDSIQHFFTDSWSDSLGCDIIRVIPLSLSQKE
ncbi:hypothetical protein C1645_830258 [Glomus cerebriforme]|uniref:Uncharacterized protein n=1 Tax=Glomus cerebriforme TaxID=658196 RepID=A0A397SIE1_9GLOM|nr:hypothetical protein C1645_830258 [Glomus cerebriforme]